MESVLNLFVCALAGIICVCRLGKMDGAKTVMRVRYLLWLVMLSVSAFSPVWGYEVSPLQVLFALCVLVDLGLGFQAWKNGQPGYVRVTQ